MGSQKETLVRLSNVVRVRSLNLRFLIYVNAIQKKKEKDLVLLQQNKVQVTLYREFSPYPFSYNLIYFLVPSG